MKFLKSIGLCLFLLTVFGVGVAEAKACRKCAMPNFADAKSRAAAIFVGKVISIKEEGTIKTFVFQTSKSWKGSGKKTISVAADLSMRYQPIFEAGKEYLMFAEIGDDKFLHVYRCSRSTAIENAADDLKLLGKARKSIKVKVKRKK
jgi:hypothetical protein